MLSRADYFTELLARTKLNTEKGLSFRHFSEAQLRARQGPKTWNVLDCLDHLHRTYSFYFPQFEVAIQQTHIPVEEQYKPGPFRPYIINSLQPKKGQRKLKMRTFGALEPNTTALDSDAVFSQFHQDRKRLMEVIEVSKNVSLNKVKLATVAGSWFKMRLGDCLLFLEAHDQRHLLQAQEYLP